MGNITLKNFLVSITIMIVVEIFVGVLTKSALLIFIVGLPIYWASLYFFKDRI